MIRSLLYVVISLLTDTFRAVCRYLLSNRHSMKTGINSTLEIVKPWPCQHYEGIFYCFSVVCNCNMKIPQALSVSTHYIAFYKFEQILDKSHLAITNFKKQAAAVTRCFYCR